MKSTFQSFTSGLIISTFLLQFSALAADPVRFSHLSMGSEAISALERMVERRAERFLSLSTAQQVKILDRADRRYDHMIARIDRWSEEKYQRKLNFAHKLLASSDEDNAVEINEQEQKDLPLLQDEKEFYTLESNEAIPTATTHTQASTQTKIGLLQNLKTNQQSIRDLKSEILKQAQNTTGAFRKIAASTTTKALLTALFAVLIVAGVFAIIFGLAITVATLGLLAPAGLALVTIGAIVITGSVIAIPLFWTKM